jgi:hypothetical protein
VSPKVAEVAFPLVVAAACAAGSAVAQTLYRWTDAEGKVQYSDRPPKNFKGEVTRIEADVEKATLPARTVAPAAAPPTEQKAAAPRETDIAAKRRATRAQLEARMERARENLETARKALADGENPEPEERQIVQQRVTPRALKDMTPRSNCRVDVIEGKKTIICPTAVPSTEYHERVNRLEEAVRQAEAELADAESAWRRGVD